MKAADLRPGTPSMVRDATIAVEDGPVLAVWVPSHETGAAPDGMAFRLPAGARLAVRIHYKKSWQDERTAKSDRSAIGVYLTDAPAPGHELREMVTSGSTVLAEQTTIVAIRPELDRPYAAIDVHARLAGGGRVPLLRLRSRAPSGRGALLACPVSSARQRISRSHGVDGRGRPAVTGASAGALLPRSRWRQKSGSMSCLDEAGPATMPRQMTRCLCAAIALVASVAAARARAERIDRRALVATFCAECLARPIRRRPRRELRPLAGAILESLISGAMRVQGGAERRAIAINHGQTLGGDVSGASADAAPPRRRFDPSSGPM